MHSGLKTTILLATMSGVLLAIGSVFGQGGLMFAFVMAIVMNVGSYWFSDKVVLRMYNATEVGPDHVLSRVTARLAQRAHLPMPRVYVIPQASPNAFATGRNPEHAAVAATEGILRLLPEDELEGVIAHELTHVKHRDTLISTIAAMMAATIMMVANMMQWGMIFGVGSRDENNRGGNVFAMLATIILAPLAATLIQAAISRQREFAADRGGAEIAGTPVGLAHALRDIDAAVQQVPLDANPATAHMFIIQPFSGDGMRALFSSHPPTADRIRALMSLRA